MNTPSLTTETDNLVLFPSSKNFPSEKGENLSDDSQLEDPMLDLLMEFSNLSEADLMAIEGLEAKGINEEETDKIYDSLEAYMNRNKSLETLSEDDRLALLIDERIGQIHEARARIKFYLDEIEMFLPSKR